MLQKNLCNFGIFRIDWLERLNFANKCIFRSENQSVLEILYTFELNVRYFFTFFISEIIWINNLNK